MRSIRGKFLCYTKFLNRYCRYTLDKIKKNNVKKNSPMTDEYLPLFTIFGGVVVVVYHVTIVAIGHGF